jgi:hypothetical protein
LKHGAEAREHGLEAAAASAAAWLGGLQRPGPVGRAGDAVTVLKGRGGEVSRKRDSLELFFPSLDAASVDVGE